MTTPMPTETELLLSAYVDGELDAGSSLAFERRLAEEPDLARTHAEILALRTQLREGLTHDMAPESLRQALARIGKVETAVPTTTTLPWRARLGAGMPSLAQAEWRMALAACVVGLIAGSGLTTLVTATRPEAPVMAEVVSDHLRAVMASQPFDVASSDQHTVKPWFTGRLPFAPQVFDLATEGFPLIGGRVDVLNGQPAAALVFRRGKHLISLLSQPIEGAPVPAKAAADRGFQVRDWTVGAMRYWAVSDVASGELDAFEAAVKARLT